MKKIISLLLIIAVVFGFSLLAVGSGSEKASEDKGEDSSESNENEAGKSDAVFKITDSYAKIQTDSIGSVYITVAYSVQNTGKVNVFLKDGTADIEKKDGTLEDTVDYIGACPQVLKPGETGWYYEHTLYEGKEKSDIKIVPHPNVEKATSDCIRYKISEGSIKDESYMGVVITGRAENTTKEDSESVKVIANMFDKNGKLIGQDFTYIDDGLAAGEKKSFKISSLDSSLKASDVAKYDIYAYPYQYNW